MEGQNEIISSTENYKEKDKEENKVPLIELVLDIGTNQNEKLKIYDIQNPERDIYEFCMEHRLNYETMEEINKQIKAVVEHKKLEFDLNINEDQMDKKHTIEETKPFLTTNQNDEKQKNKPQKYQSPNSLFPYQLTKNYNDNSKRKKSFKPHFSKTSKKPNSMPISEKKYEVTPKELLNGEIIKTEENKYILGLTERNKNNKKRKISVDERGIYERGLKARQNTLNKIKEIKDLITQGNLDYCTFHPTINSLSNEAKEKRTKEKMQCTNCERILNYKTYYDNKINKLKQKQKEEKRFKEEKENSTFHPKINKNSKNIDLKCSSQEQKRYEKLFEDEKVRKGNLESLQKQIDNKYNYQPKLNDNHTITESFEKRQVGYIIKSKEKMDLIKGKIKTKEDEMNIFKPMLHKNKRYETIEKRSKGRVFENLYLDDKKYTQRKQELKNRWYNNNNCFINISPNRCSSTMMDNKKIRAFKQLFTLLDSDGDNLITPTTINVNRIPKNISEILKPIIIELKQEKETLNEVEFINVCDKLYQILSYDKKREFINFEGQGLEKRNSRRSVENFTFKPIINKKSARLARESIIKDMNRISRLSRDYNNAPLSITNKSNGANYLLFENPG